MSNEPISADVYKTILEAINNIDNSAYYSSLTDVYLVIDYSSGELIIYDDEHRIVAQNIINSWSDLSEKTITRQLRSALEELDNKSEFDKLDLFKPFSVNLADNDFVVLEELLLIDDDSLIRLDDDFMKQMDKEFDDFLDRLMKE